MKLARPDFPNQVLFIPQLFRKVQFLVGKRGIYYNKSVEKIPKDLILYLNTSDPNKNQIALKRGSKITRKIYKTGYNQTESLLAEIDRLFKKSKAMPKDLTGIVVSLGPGPFTALRVSITVANSLSYSLNVPAAGLKNAEFRSLSDFIKKGRKKILKKRGVRPLFPYYGKEPNITKSRK